MSRLIRPAFGPWSRREFLRSALWSAGAAGTLGLAACGTGISFEVTLPFSACPSGVCP